MHGMEGPPYQYDEIIEYIADDTPPQDSAINLDPFPGEVGRTATVTYGTIEDRGVLVIEECRDHGRVAGYDTHLRKRTVIVDPATSQIIYVSRTRTSRKTKQDILKYQEVIIDNDVCGDDEQLSKEIQFAHLLVQDVYQYGKNPPLPQSIEVVEER